MKVLICPQCGGNVHLTQYPGVYHCRYCRTLVYEETIQELDLKQQEIDLSRQMLADTQEANRIRTERVKLWQKVCFGWWIFILFTFILGFLGGLGLFRNHELFGIILQDCVLLRIPGSPAVAAFRPDESYPDDAPPSCSKSALLLIFWMFDMILWGFLFSFTI